MKIIKLYRYIREDGGVTVSTNVPDCEYTEKYRLVADEEKMLTLDGEKLYGCVDTDCADGWYEVDTPNEYLREGLK